MSKVSEAHHSRTFLLWDAWAAGGCAPSKQGGNKGMIQYARTGKLTLGLNESPSHSSWHIENICLFPCKIMNYVLSLLKKTNKTLLRNINHSSPFVSNCKKYSASKWLLNQRFYDIESKNDLKASMLHNVEEIMN